MPAVLELSDLNGTNGFSIRGRDAFGQFGYSVSGAGDVNGDALDDFIVSASPAGAPSTHESGEAFVVFGSSNGFPARFDLLTLDGSNGFRIAPAGPFDLTSISVSDAGDVNDDGFDDIVIGAPGVVGDPDLSGLGAAYVVFGSSSGFAATLDLASLNGSNGFRVTGAIEEEAFSGDQIGWSVSSAGDVNADGIDDFVVGAPFSPANDVSGLAYVIFGRTGFPETISLDSLDGSYGFRIDGVNFVDETGRSVSAAGDVNGDGIGDLVVGAPGAAEMAGSAYVLFGSDSGFAPIVDLRALNGTNGFRVDGGFRLDGIGYSVSAAGDVNGDGIGDIIVGAAGSGAAYVVFGSRDGFEPSFNVTSLDGSNGFILSDPGIETIAGFSVSSGDFNGDGIGDLLVGDPFGRPRPGFADGRAYVVFGTTAGFPAELELASLDGFNGMVINGLDHDDQVDDVGAAGLSVSGAGDVNGDGIDDILIGAPFVDFDGDVEVGESYVIFGSRLFGPQPEARAHELDLHLTIGDSGRVTARLNAGGVATVRKNGVLVPVDGDNAGLTNISARNVTAAATTLTGNSAANDIDGSDQADTIAGGGGADELSGFAGADTISGGAGNDTLDGGADSDSLNGGGGRDVLIGGLGSDTVVGGFGDDLFSFERGHGADVFKDFFAGGSTDEIRLTGFGPAFDSFAKVLAAASPSGANVIIDFGGGDSLTLQNVALANLTTGDFLFG